MGGDSSADPAFSPAVAKATPPKSDILDLTHPLVPASVPACPGHPIYNAVHTFKLAEGAFANVHTLTMGSHTGTHIDAPFHFYMEGTTVDALDLSLLVNAPALVVDLRRKKAHERITWEDLRAYEGRMGEGVVLLLCTGWSRYFAEPMYSDHPFLDAEAAQRVVDTGVRVIGVDALSPDEWEPQGDTGKVHRIVLGNGGVIVENLCGLGDLVDSGWERVSVSLSPLRLKGCDGSPIRAVAWRKD